ncbi:MAG TPA: PBP1A family penicillin-binding protein [Caulobacteraceae bacterium]
MPSFSQPAARPAPRGPEAHGYRPRSPWRWLLAIPAILGVMLGLGAIAAAGIAALYLRDVPPLPSNDALQGIRRSPGMTFLDRNGAVIATRGAKNGQAVTLASLPAYVPKAFLAAEDRRFYQHGPIDLHAVLRAVVADLRAHRSAEGASTLSQQLARTLFLQRDQSLKRKVQEADLAWQLEQRLSKDQILELYMNHSFYGDGAYGLDAAAQTYFSKPASQLTLAEAATLAGLPNAPTRLALTTNMPAALARERHILQVMRDENWIDDGQLTAATNTPPTLVLASHPGEGDNGYILDMAAEQATQLTGGATPDLIVRTTIDPALQATAVGDVRGVVLKEGLKRHVSQGALVSLAPDGAILAMVGGLNHDASSFNRVTQAHRQPGSSFKAFVFGAAVEKGDTPWTTSLDAPITLAGWSPENYERDYAGEVTLTDALARSLNTVSVRLTEQVTPRGVAAFARRLGLTDIPLDPGPSIALGAYEVTPLELATGYQVYQTGGGLTQPYLVSQVSSTSGAVLYNHAVSAPTPVLDPLYATRMITMLKQVVLAGTGTGANIGRPEAGKTGTSQNWRDAWFVGFTPDVLTAVWVGNDDGAPMAKVTGGELPAEIWRKYMTVAEAKLPARDFPWLVPEQPGGVTAIPVVNDESGQGYEDEPTIDAPPDTTAGGQGPPMGPPGQVDGDAPSFGRSDGDSYAEDGGRDAPPGRYPPPPNGDDPPPQADRGPPVWSGQPSGRGYYYDPGPPPGADQRQRLPAPDEMPADAEPRYRY